MFWAQNDAGRERIIEVLEKMGEEVSPVLKDGWK
jgi:3-hydroxyacyl-CoA dehydrogenase